MVLGLIDGGSVGGSHRLVVRSDLAVEWGCCPPETSDTRAEVGKWISTIRESHGDFNGVIRLH